MQKIQLPFVKNEGQAAENISFYSKTFGCTVVVTKTGEIVYLLPQKTKNITLKEVLIGSKASDISGEDKAAANINYFLGNEKAKWKSNIPVFNLVDFGEVYDGIGLKLKAYGRNVEKLFFVRPEADYKKIRLEMKGAVKIEVNPAGELEAETELGLVKFTKPVAYQEIDGKRVEVKVEYELSPVTSHPSPVYSFKVGDYDLTKELIIDPLIAATFLGGNDDDQINAIALDSAGNVYLAGQTKSTQGTFPLTAGVLDNTHNGNYDVFVSKFSPDLSTLTASTYIGGTGEDIANGMAIKEPGGQIYIAGTTSSTDFPSSAGVYQVNHVVDSSKKDAFIAKLNSDLTSDAFASTFLGGDGDDEAMAIAIHSDGNIYVAGETTSSNFPTAGAPYKNYCGTNAGNPCNRDNSLTNIQIANGTSATVSYTLNVPVNASSIVVKVAGCDDATDNGAGSISRETGGCPFVTGTINYSTGALSLTFAEAPGAAVTVDYTYRTPKNDGFISKLSDDLTGLSASTYIGGSSDDNVYDLAVSSGGNVYITGITMSADFPTVEVNRVQAVHGGLFDAFVSRLDSNLASLGASTFYGGNGADLAFAIAIKDNDVYVGGSYTGGNAFVTKFNDTLSSASKKDLAGATNNNSNAVYSMAISGSDIYIAGSTASPDFISTIKGGAYTDAYDIRCGTNGTANCDYDGSTYYSDAFAAKLSAADLSVGAVTYIGGSKSDNGRAIAVNSTTGKVYAAGYTKASDFPALGGKYTAFGGGTDVNDAFVARLDSNLSPAYISASPSSLSFPVGDHVVFSSSGSTPSSKDVTITNSDTHNSTLTISGISIVGGGSSTFSKSTTCVLDQPMAQDAQCTVTVTFTPTTTGAVTGTLRISSDGTNGGATTDILLSGTGVQQYSVTVTKAGNGTGSFESSNNSTNGFNPEISCSSGGCPSQTRYFDAGLALRLDAYADSPGSIVTAWSGCLSSDLTSTPPTCTISDAGHPLAADKNINVTFSLKTYALTVDKAGTGTGTVTGAGTYNHGSTATVTATADAGSIFSGWSGDCAGSNSSTTVSMTGVKNCTATFTDNMAPTATISGISSPNNLTALEVTVGGADVTHYKYKLDNGPYSAETAVAIPVTLTALTDGSHTVSVIGRDAAGNWQSDSSPTTANWTVDTIAPAATISGTPASPANVRTATLTVAGTDVTHYKYKLDNGPYSAETAVAIPVTLTALTDGSHTVSVIGRDTAGNWQTENSATTSSAWTIDATAPVASASPAGGTYNADQSVTLSADEAATIYYTTNGDVPTTGSPVYSKAVPITITGPGTTTVKFFAVDSLGNTEGTHTETYTVSSECKVTSVTDNNGTVTCASPVRAGSASTCTITPAPGYHLATLTDNGTSVINGVSDTYAISEVTSDHVIAATFEINTYMVTATVDGDNGTISCDPEVVNYGGSSTCTITQDKGYHVAQVLVDGEPDAVKPTDKSDIFTYAFEDVSDDHDIVASFLTNSTKPKITVSPATVNDFKKIRVEGSSLPKIYTITNTGKADLVVSAIEMVDGDSSMFVVSTGSGKNACSDLSPVIQKGKSCKISLVFAPTSGGQMSSTLRISSNDMSKPDFDIRQKGTGQYALTVTNSARTLGTVSSSPAGITCGSDCTQDYGDGVSVKLTATAKKGSVFAGWSDSECPGTGKCTVVMDGNKTVTASFSKAYSVLGTVKKGKSALKGVKVTLSGDDMDFDKNVTTRANGAYAFTGLVPGNYTITPVMSGYTFSPESISVTITAADSKNQNFSGTKQ